MDSSDDMGWVRPAISDVPCLIGEWNFTAPIRRMEYALCRADWDPRWYPNKGSQRGKYHRLPSFRSFICFLFHFVLRSYHFCGLELTGGSAVGHQKYGVPSHFVSVFFPCVFVFMDGSFYLWRRILVCRTYLNVIWSTRCNDGGYGNLGFLGNFLLGSMKSISNIPQFMGFQIYLVWTLFEIVKVNGVHAWTEKHLVLPNQDPLPSTQSF